MSFLEDIDKGLRKMGKKMEQEDPKCIWQEDPKYIWTDCPRCGAKDIKVHRMRALNGHVKCPECGASFVVMMLQEAIL